MCTLPDTRTHSRSVIVMTHVRFGPRSGAASGSGASPPDPSAATTFAAFCCVNSCKRASASASAASAARSSSARLAARSCRRRCDASSISRVASLCRAGFVRDDRLGQRRNVFVLLLGPGLRLEQCLAQLAGHLARHEHLAEERLFRLHLGVLCCPLELFFVFDLFYFFPFSPAQWSTSWT